MRIGILTSGGDAPGLNIAVYSFIKLAERKHELFAVFHGWEGFIDGSIRRIESTDLLPYLSMGGTALKTSRRNVFDNEDDVEKLVEAVNNYGLDCIVAIGGDGSLKASYKATELDIKVIHIPKTIDNDVFGTDFTIGFDSAVNAAVNVTESFKTTLISHERIGVVEVMGREAGWVALHTGLATMADATLIPEYPLTMDFIVNKLIEAYKIKHYALVVTAEGINVSDGIITANKHPTPNGIGYRLAELIEKTTGIETRAVSPGHSIRGVQPSAFDRVLAVNYAAKAYEAVENELCNVMVNYSESRYGYVPIHEVVGKNKLVSGGWLRLYEDFWVN
ncbi:6-phosphofructokinase [Caldivirga maquilingensis]|uniref:6-phosphofructokinase n=1 Tax=Caldivirga maquilingensis (strain ATCC 700844 / DSM 13496 / JCM 10307 / IC-167) TaxID=397948 RepID=A8MCH6_CALMQ|nr:6-phosphofructokinase [Caldivirga maquilingensis]ABW01482.1 6-phosphofructokinase [Caldivirga maquilingensis IC-167]